MAKIGFIFDKFIDFWLDDYSLFTRWVDTYILPPIIRKTSDVHIWGYNSEYPVVCDYMIKEGMSNFTIHGATIHLYDELINHRDKIVVVPADNSDYGLREYLRSIEQLYYISASDLNEVFLEKMKQFNPKLNIRLIILTKTVKVKSYDISSSDQ